MTKKTAISDTVKQGTTKGVVQQRVVGLPRLPLKHRHTVPRPPPDPTSHLSQDHRCAVKALDYYNKKNGTDYELVDIDASISNAFLYDGIKMHCNFKARPRVSLNGDGDSSSNLGSNAELKPISNVDDTKLFFAELIVRRCRWIVKSCCILKGKLGNCLFCEGFVKHPIRGFRSANKFHAMYVRQTYGLRPRAHH